MSEEVTGSFIIVIGVRMFFGCVGAEKAIHFFE